MNERPSFDPDKTQEYSLPPLKGDQELNAIIDRVEWEDTMKDPKKKEALRQELAESLSTMTGRPVQVLDFDRIEDKTYRVDFQVESETGTIIVKQGERRL